MMATQKVVLVICKLWLKELKQLPRIFLHEKYSYSPINKLTSAGKIKSGFVETSKLPTSNLFMSPKKFKFDNFVENDNSIKNQNSVENQIFFENDNSIKNQNSVENGNLSNPKKSSKELIKLKIDEEINNKNNKIVSKIDNFLDNGAKNKFKNTQNLRGFVNLGNTCYINSVLQSLLHLKTFCQTLSNKKNFLLKNDNFCFEILKLVQKRQNSQNNGEIFQKTEDILLNVKTKLVKTEPVFADNRQQDAHEFWTTLLNQFSKDFSDKLPEKESPENVCFCFSIRQTVVCTGCEFSRNSVVRNYDLSLNFGDDEKGENSPILSDLKNGGNFGRNKIIYQSVQDMLNSYFQPKMADFSCEKCKNNSVLIKQEIYQNPRILVLHFKRFCFEKQNGQYFRAIKLHNSVQIDRKIDLANFSQKMGQKNRYDLRSVIHHRGQTVESGHYVADVLAGKDKNWFCFDDENVQNIDVSTLDQKDRRKSCYILFYELDDNF
ncbi:hypothetical protein MHBO_001651 [Bonamia ostreae]|uniref:Ubiquitin carboxyl-terminal hydrolase n=1 Tax=Bonamia ostreae TaxID=126728 RepID=A0ABV2AJP5_9EUKA